MSGADETPWTGTILLAGLPEHLLSPDDGALRRWGSDDSRSRPDAPVRWRVRGTGDALALVVAGELQPLTCAWLMYRAAVAELTVDQISAEPVPAGLDLPQSLAWQVASALSGAGVGRMVVTDAQGRQHGVPW